MAFAGILAVGSLPASAAVAYDQTIVAIFGTGNPDTGWTTGTGSGITLGLRGKDRVTASTANASGVYGPYATGLVPPANTRAYWNWEFSINSGATNLSVNYDYYVAIDLDPTQGINYAVVDALAFWTDNSYGIDGTLNGQGTEGTAAALAGTNNIAQQSQNLVFVVGGNPNLDATYNYELFAVAKGAGSAGSRLASVGITVVVGAGGTTSAAIAAPTISNIQPAVVALGTPITVTAQVSGGATILAASYSIDGVPAGPMSASDGLFDQSSEGVQANFTGLPVGVYTVSVSAIDSAGNWSEESALLAVFDPSAGFVTGGGWINSTAGAFTGPNAWQTRWDQGFAVDTAGWFDSDSGWYGQISAQPDGTALVMGDTDSGPFSRFDGYHNTWPGTWLAEIDIYLDPAALAAGQGFDYSVAATNSATGLHRRDYIFHVTKDTSSGKLLVAGSNNTNFAPREDLETINHYEITTAGWYTLQHRFYDVGGVLKVDLNLVDSAGQIVFTETRSDPSDLIPSVVGGNRYAWFTHVTVPGGIVVDNHQRFELAAGKANFGFVSKYKKGATVPEGSTEFVFTAGDLNFHSSSYEWLVVNQNGTNAQFKGVGTINGAGNYGFMIWASDNATGGTADTFRIHIWDKNNGDATVYDNGVEQALGGGNIMVQTKK